MFFFHYKFYTLAEEHRFGLPKDKHIYSGRDDNLTAQTQIDIVDVDARQITDRDGEQGDAQIRHDVFECLDEPYLYLLLGVVMPYEQP
jgi:hypothetical protein